MPCAAASITSRPWVALFYALALLLLAFTGLSAGLGTGFYIMLVAAAGFAMVQLALWNMDDPENCLRRFHANRDFGLIVLLGIVLGHFL